MEAKTYNEIVSLHADGLYRFILKNIKDEAEAQDVVQDAFEKLWLNKDNVVAAKGKSYLFTIAYHIMIDKLRRNKRIVRIEEKDLEISYVPEPYTGTKEMLDKALEKLPEVQRSVVLLRDYEGYSYQEIGVITGLSESQVKVYIHRARETMRKLIEKIENYRYANI